MLISSMRDALTTLADQTTPGVPTI